MKIDKKCWPKSFEAILKGEKSFDVRIADFDCEPGDVLHFREWDPKKQEYTGRSIEKQVKHVMKTKNQQYWNQDDIDLYGFQVLGF